MENELRLNVRIPAELYREFKAETARRGITMSDAVREMIEQWLAEHTAQTSK
jgi:antitoxin component of RelBE/YafQ-DinJ toxin-antitoxin module